MYDYQVELGKLVRRERRQRGWTQQQLSDELRSRGVDLAQSGVARLELGTRRPPVDELLVLADLFGLAVYEVLPISEATLGPRGGTRAGG